MKSITLINNFKLQINSSIDIDKHIIMINILKKANRAILEEDIIEEEVEDEVDTKSIEVEIKINKIMIKQTIKIEQITVNIQLILILIKEMKINQITTIVNHQIEDGEEKQNFIIKASNIMTMKARLLNQMKKLILSAH